LTPRAGKRCAWFFSAGFSHRLEALVGRRIFDEIERDQIGFDRSADFGNARRMDVVDAGTDFVGALEWE
jgi:hypothetical protein